MGTCGASKRGELDLISLDDIKDGRRACHTLRSSWQTSRQRYEEMRGWITPSLAFAECPVGGRPLALVLGEETLGDPTHLNLTGVVNDQCLDKNQALLSPISVGCPSGGLPIRFVLKHRET